MNSLPSSTSIRNAPPSSASAPTQTRCMPLFSTPWLPLMSNSLVSRPSLHVSLALSRSNSNHISVVWAICRTKNFSRLTMLAVASWAAPSSTVSMSAISATARRRRICSQLPVRRRRSRFSSFPVCANVKFCHAAPLTLPAESCNWCVLFCVFNSILFQRRFVPIPKRDWQSWTRFGGSTANYFSNTFCALISSTVICICFFRNESINFFSTKL